MNNPEERDDESEHELKRVFEALIPVPELTDDDLARYASAIQVALEGSDVTRVGERQLRKPARVHAAARAHDRARPMLMKLYRARADRLATALLGLSAIGLAVAVLRSPNLLSTGELLAVSIAVGGVMLFVTSIQSGRAGFLQALQTDQLNDWAASLSTVVARGHQRVHEVEADVVNSARLKRSARLMAVEIWSRPRTAEVTHDFKHLEHQLLRYAEEVADGDFRVALSCTKSNIDQMREMMLERLGKARQRFFYGNPLQFDIIISDNEAVLSLSRSGTDRDLAFHFRNPTVVHDLWEILESQLGGNVYVESDVVEDAGDVDVITRRVEAAAGPERYSVCWDE